MPHTQETCPLCASSVVARKADDQSLYAFADHDDCGPFQTSTTQLHRLRMTGADAERERLGAKVRAAKAKGKKPPTI